MKIGKAHPLSGHRRGRLPPVRSLEELLGFSIKQKGAPTAAGAPCVGGAEAAIPPAGGG